MRRAATVGTAAVLLAGPSFAQDAAMLEKGRRVNDAATPKCGMCHSIAGKGNTEGPRVFLGVKDPGPGIAPEHRDRVFERFYRVDKSRSREMGGTGLGLSLVKWAAEAHGGHFEIETEEGRGSTFRMLLPAPALH